MSAVNAEQRSTRDNPCPICGGTKGDARGGGRRCHGFRSSGGRYHRCSREDCAGGIEPGDDGLYPHCLDGNCRCGQTHGEAEQSNSNGESKRRIVATYDYRDENGQLLYQAVRYEPKGFSQRQPDGERWSYELNGVRRVLYHLDRLLEADPEQTVHIVEGEKDVESLERLGLLATTNAMGAGKWSTVASHAGSVLRGRHVVVIADADKPGREHARNVADSLTDCAVKVIEMPGAKDVSDWIAAGGTAEQLEAIIAAGSAPKRRWRRCRDLVDEILARAAEPLVSLRLGGDEIASMRSGGIVLLIGGTGRGKSSLAVTLLVEHGRDIGPAIAWSLELPGDEWTGRAIGTRCDEAWLGVLTGAVPRDRMIEVLPERLATVGRDESIDALVEAIDDLRREYPDEPILVAVDYTQLIPSDEEQTRQRVGDAMRKLDKVAREKRVALIALSQGSRMSSRALSSGEKIGGETTDAGAESADLERWASLTLAIGQLGPEAEDGTCAAEISIGKSRMGRGDRVIPARYNGRSGLWRLSGEARPAAEVRAERDAERENAKQRAAELAIVAAATQAPEPQTREDLIKVSAATQKVGRAAMVAVLMRRDVVEVDRKRVRSRAYLVWTRSNAEAAGVGVVGDDDE